MQIHEVSLAKKKLITEDRTYLLWESVGRTLVEAQLTPAQIQQVFSQAEQGSTAAGNNRTSIGQVKDAGSAVASAWNDLKSKVQNSGPIRNIDAAYDQAAEKLKQATGGDAGVMKYVEKYRKFAKEHPIAQSFIYAALIAAAGISGAGAGGAAALGLLKMTDKLLQGEKFSSAAYAGATTGALAYGAGQLGKALQGQISDMPPDSAYNKPISSYSYDGKGIPVYNLPAEAYDYTPLPGGGYQFVANDNKLAQILSQELGKTVRPEEAQDLWIKLANQGRQQMGQMMNQGAAAQGLQESQIRKAFYAAAGLQTQLNEGVWDSIKGAAGKAAGAVGKYVQTKGHNLTTRVTADKLMSAWKSAGSPTDSEAVADVMRNAGVDEQIVTSVLAAVAKTPGTKTRTGGRVAGQLSQTPNAVRKRQARAANKAPATTTTPTTPATGGAGAFGQMAQQITTPATQTSSTGGTTQRTSTGLTHKANPNNPNLKVKESDKYEKSVAESWEAYKLDEGFGSAIGGLAGKVAGGINKVGTAVASPFRDAAAGYRGGKVDAKTASIADKAYRAWSAYRQQLDKAAGGQADPKTLEKQLLAFVSKNLLGGKQLSNLINKDQILKLVKQIATGGQLQQAPAKTAPPAQAAQSTGARMGKASVAKTKTPTAKTPAGKTAPGAGAFGQMTKQLGGTAGATSTGGTAAPTATGVKHSASATNPNQPAGATQSMADFTKQNPTAKYHEVTGEITPYGQQQADIKAKADQTRNAASAEKYKQQSAQADVDYANTMKIQQQNNPANPAKAMKTAQDIQNQQVAQGLTTLGKVPSTPAAEPVSIGGQKLNPKDPKQAELIKKAQAAAAKTSNPTVQEAAAPAQELELFKKLVTQVAQAQAEVDPNATAQAVTTPGTQPGQANKALKGTAAKSTGNPKADALLAQNGYKVQA